MLRDLTPVIEYSAYQRYKRLMSPDDRRERRHKRAISRFLRGRELPASGYLLTTLTTPEYLPQGSLHRVWRLFLWRVRNTPLKGLEYYGCREWNRRQTCEHLHMVFRCDWISYEQLRALWTKSVHAVCAEHGVPYPEDGNVWVWVEQAKDKYRQAYYLSKYLSKNELLAPNQRGYWYSATWVCRGFAGWQTGIYCGGCNVELQDIIDCRADISKQAYLLWDCLRVGSGFKAGQRWFKELEKSLARRPQAPPAVLASAVA